MHFSQLLHYTRRVLELGPRASITVLKNRYQKKRTYQACKRKALAHTAHYEWEIIAARHKVQQSFPSFLWQLRYTSDAMFPVSLLRPFADDVHNQEKADRFVVREYDLLGSGSIQFDQMPWHEDFRLREQNQEAHYTFNPHQFYQDVVVQTGTGPEFVKDIKVPWELSRCYHFSVLGQAYQATCDKKYVDAFVGQTESWMQENPFMLGVNWVCPMEVGIRAINWVCAFYYFKDAPQVSDVFWEQFVCILYDHFVYLENNWEVYDSRTSNHYLSDLVGYFSLCCFFIDLQGVQEKQLWCAQEIMREWDKQVFAEGTDYEGSTAYHGLVTELFFVFTQFCKKTDLLLSENMSHLLSSMIEFMAWVTPQSAAQIVTVGDNDSGRVLYHGLPKSLVQAASELQLGTRQFSEFGVSVIKTKNYHVTLRHHVYNKRQPSGHFHNDAGSITLAVNGVPVFVDPGSYVYTPSAMWRNYFRSVAVHNTFYIEGKEPVSLDEHLFGLSLPEKRPGIQENSSHIKTLHHLYAQYQVISTRALACDDAGSCITITDAWQALPGYDEQRALISAWNFTLAPGIVATEQDGVWHLKHNSQLLVRLHSENLDFSVDDAWHSPAYGIKVPTRALRARGPLVVGAALNIRIVVQ